MGEVTRIPIGCGNISATRSGWVPGLPPSPFLECPLHFPLRIPFGDVVPPVILTLAFCYSQFHLHFSALEVEFQRHEGEPTFLRPVSEPIDFVLV